MKIALVCVGRPHVTLGSAIAEYERRMSRYFRFEAMEVKETPYRGQPIPQLLDDEGERLLARVPKHNHLVALHRTGESWNSEALARFLADGGLVVAGGVTFVIGGAYGLSSGLLQRADLRLSLSGMTLPHELARLVLAEQLYRAGTIIRGEPYHKPAVS